MVASSSLAFAAILGSSSAGVAWAMVGNTASGGIVAVAATAASNSVAMVAANFGSTGNVVAGAMAESSSEVALAAMVANNSRLLSAVARVENNSALVAAAAMAASNSLLVVGAKAENNSRMAVGKAEDKLGMAFVEWSLLVGVDRFLWVGCSGGRAERRLGKVDDRLRLGSQVSMVFGRVDEKVVGSREGAFDRTRLMMDKLGIGDDFGGMVWVAVERCSAEVSRSKDCYKGCCLWTRRLDRNRLRVSVAQHRLELRLAERSVGNDLVHPGAILERNLIRTHSRCCHRRSFVAVAGVKLPEFVLFLRFLQDLPLSSLILARRKL